MYCLKAVPLNLENKEEKSKNNEGSNRLTFLHEYIFFETKKVAAPEFVFAHFGATWSIDDPVLAPTGF